MTAPDAMNPAELTKKLKATRKRLKSAERTIASVEASNKSLEDQVAKMQAMQDKLMHNLRRALSKLGMRPESITKG